MTCVYKEYERIVKMVKMELTTAKMKLLLSYNMKIVN